MVIIFESKKNNKYIYHRTSDFRRSTAFTADIWLTKHRSYMNTQLTGQLFCLHEFIGKI